MTKEEVKKMRVDNNLTQKQLAELIGVSTRTVQRWEAGLNMSEIAKNFIKKLSDK